MTKLPDKINEDLRNVGMWSPDGRFLAIDNYTFSVASRVPRLCEMEYPAIPLGWTKDGNNLLLVRNRRKTGILQFDDSDCVFAEIASWPGGCNGVLSHTNKCCFWNISLLCKGINKIDHFELEVTQFSKGWFKTVACMKTTGMHEINNIWVCWSPDNQLVAINYVGSLDKFSRVYLYSANLCRLVHTIRDTGVYDDYEHKRFDLRSSRWSADSKYYVATAVGGIKLWCRDSGKETLVPLLRKGCVGCIWSPVGKKMLVFESVSDKPNGNGRYSRTVTTHYMSIYDFTDIQKPTFIVVEQLSDRNDISTRCPKWSPCGKMIAVIVDYEYIAACYIDLMSASGHLVRRIYCDDGPRRARDRYINFNLNCIKGKAILLEWSPPGDRLAICSETRLALFPVGKWHDARNWQYDAVTRSRIERVAAGTWDRLQARLALGVASRVARISERLVRRVCGLLIPEHAISGNGQPAW